ncbi:MAG TPA: hypothetical protein VMY39_02665, partial [Planctomycetota bacterium]|nr:hypothetical protein [Planctomycetota bacterium]
SDYVIVKGVRADSPGHWILLHDKSAENHKGQGRHCFFNDGHVQWLTEDDFQRRMKAQADALGKLHEHPEANK